MSEAITPQVRAVENMVARAREKTKKSTTPACPVCRITLWMSLFFDGTGNHRENDFPKNHSNVAALFDAHVNDPENGVIPFYYEGLGRQFSFKDRYEEVVVPTRGGAHVSKREGYEEDDDGLLGKGFANGITERLEKALFDLTKSINDWRAQRGVDEINLAVFGFSRGATEARAFLHWLAAHSKVKTQGRKLSFEGIPLNVKFLGVFDTVESVGLAGTNKMPDLIKTKVPSFVEKCTHIVAAHELRDAFPLTIANGSHRCVVYPGAHADIGGGYVDKQQGRSDKLARIALLQMLDEARGAGLKMMSLSEMRSDPVAWKHRLMCSFDPPVAAQSALKQYLQVTKPVGNISDHMQAHMNAYWRWIDSGQAMADVQSKLKADRNQHEREVEYRRMTHMLRFLARTPVGRGDGGLQVGMDTKVPKPITEFFSGYVHDSFEHFSATGGTLQTDLSTADYYHLRKINQPVG
jgi:uncharacterized protein (DUF2235 family)